MFHIVSVLVVAELIAVSLVGYTHSSLLCRKVEGGPCAPQPKNPCFSKLDRAIPASAMTFRASTNASCVSYTVGPPQSIVPRNANANATML